MEDTTPSKPIPQPVLTRVRVTFSKSGSLIYTGALDLQNMWEHILRRAKLNVAYTQGFNPVPRINLASALPLCVSSEQELADFWFVDEPDLTEFCDRVNKAAPSGLKALTAEVVTLSTPALQTRVDSAEYRTGSMPGDVFQKVQEAIINLLSASTLPRERRGKSYDLRPLIEEITLTPGPSPTGRGEISGTRSTHCGGFSQFSRNSFSLRAALAMAWAWGLLA
jgi:radical SAM-linked protein